MTRRVPPSFDFFPDDFVGGTLHMDAIEVGMYVRCLCFQWGRAKLPVTPEKLMRITSVFGAEFESHWPVVAEKFAVTEDGYLQNHRLEVERAKKVALNEARREAGRKGGCSKAKNLLVAKSLQREVGSRKKEEGRKEDGRGQKSRAPFVPPTTEQVAEYATSLGFDLDATAFVSSYEQKGWMVGKSPMRDWRAAVRNWKANGWGLRALSKSKHASVEEAW